MKEQYLNSKLDELIATGKEPSYESISIKEFITEFDYATLYLSRLLKARSLVMYLLLFKKAYLEEGKRIVSIKASEISDSLLSDLGRPMSNDTVRKGINELIQGKIIGVSSSIKPGQVNKYEIRLPSELREVQDMIKKDKEQLNEFVDDSRNDYFTDQDKRIEILKRDNYSCFYCFRELPRDDFYLDHIIPKTQGGHNYQYNLVSSCKSCNTKKNNIDAQTFLLQNYWAGLLTQDEYKAQKGKMKYLDEEYKDLKT